MAVNLGSSAISKLYIGSTESQKAYLGSNLIFDNAPAAGNWSPAELSTLVGWYKASQANTVSLESSVVAGISDLSGNTNAFYQDTASLRPLYNETLDTKSVITFDNTVYLNLASNISGVKAAVFVTDQMAGNQIDNQIAPVFGEETQDQDHTFIRTNLTDYSISIDGSNSNTGNASYDGESLVSGGNIDFGLSVVQKAAPRLWYADYDTAVQLFYLGALDVGSGFRRLDGNIAEIIFLDTVPSTADRQRLEGYLAHEWGLESNLATGHPYILATPATTISATTPVNSVAPVITGLGYAGQEMNCTTGTWSGGGLKYTYQWKANGVNISQAVTPRYIVNSANEGASITCEVTATNNAGSVSATSNAIHIFI